MKLKIVSLLLTLVALAVPASGQSLQLKVGPADSPGQLALLLVQGEASLPVALELEPMSSEQKAAALAQAVAADPSGAWRALVDGSVLTFQRHVDGEWLEVDALHDVTDTTGGGAQLATESVASEFTLELPTDVTASGYDAVGKPAVFTLTLTDTLTFIRTLQPGDSAEQVFDQLQAYLQEEAGSGVAVTRAGPAAMVLSLAYAESSFNWQVTDTLLRPKASGDTDAGVIHR